ncbi:MAG TPA: TIM barrel protein [Candidatus Eisenbacteria bacterium]|jgi:L-rhamnose isomerase/sugar isomerase|nr:TIM barrel protein [Candidatus Eisenbacteria bacterium]
MTNEKYFDRAWKALDRLHIELPSWGFANTGTRFGKFIQPAAATSIEEKFSDAAQVHHFTGACPTLALHVQWDLPNGLQDAAKVRKLSDHFAIRPGSINPNIFQDQEYKYGSIGNPNAAIRKKALDHILECVKIADQLQCRDISPWFADGSNYPGSQNIRKRIEFFEEGLREVHQALKPGQRLLIEYKPFEPAFYHTDIADWGMAYLLAKQAGPQSRVLVDTGHHYQAQNVEQIVAWLLHREMIGGFHFNDRRYADDDLTLGSIDPYQVFRIFHEIHTYEWEKGSVADIVYMVDQSHNLKGKIEAMIQTVCTAQELYARAALVNHERLAKSQQECSLVDAEETLRGAFWEDTRGAVREWRRSKGIPENPLEAFRQSGYLEQITAERRARNTGASVSYA